MFVNGNLINAQQKLKITIKGFSYLLTKTILIFYQKFKKIHLNNKLVIYKATI